MAQGGGPDGAKAAEAVQAVRETRLETVCGLSAAAPQPKTLRPPYSCERAAPPP